MIATLRLLVASVLVGAALLVLLPLQTLTLILLPGRSGLLPVIFHRIILRVFGVRLLLEGKMVRERPLLIVANHVSWLDIAVLGSVAPLSFVAKSEMASWPLFGRLAKLQRTVFIKRDERRSSGDQANVIAERMTAREIMVLFPEGTTSDGNALLPFKTPLFEAAKLALADSPVEEAVVQPVAIHYTRLHGLPLGRARRPHVAWPGDIGLLESLVPIVMTGALDVVVKIGDPIRLMENSNRKVVAAQAHSSIRQMLAD